MMIRTPVEYKCFPYIQAVGGLGWFAFEIGGSYIGEQFAYIAAWAFCVTGFLLLLFICKSSLRNSLLWLKIEIVICAILTIGYIFATFETIQTTWHYLWIFYNAYKLCCSAATLVSQEIQTFYAKVFFIFVIFADWIIVFLNQTTLGCHFISYKSVKFCFIQYRCAVWQQLSRMLTTLH